MKNQQQITLMLKLDVKKKEAGLLAATVSPGAWTFSRVNS